MQVNGHFEVRLSHVALVGWEHDGPFLGPQYTTAPNI